MVFFNMIAPLPGIFYVMAPLAGLLNILAPLNGIFFFNELAPH